VWGPPPLLEELERRIPEEAPPLARVERIAREDATPASVPPPEFRIVGSDHVPAERGRVTVDSAVCPACLSEMWDGEDRRYRQGLVNCTDCGPRYTIVRDLPYDRPLTTMAEFPLCAACAEEYDDPMDRRFHAQPVCCPECGPRVTLTDASGEAIPGDPYRETARLLERGRVVAMKGLGGYHLVADATSPEAVKLLRERKRRDHKPFALMARSLEEARSLVRLSEEGEALLTSPTAPIVIATRRGGPDPAADPAEENAPGQNRLGVMVPYTPMQHLLAAEITGPVVMTSANLSDDPLVKDRDDARARLRGIADAYLTHDRPIERAVDDSVFVDTGGHPLPVRRGRGYVPAPLPLPTPAPEPWVSVGSDLKNTVAVIPGEDAILSQHVGDLTHTLAHRRFTRTLDDLQRLFDATPRWVAVDRHPRYLSRHHGLRLARDADVPVVEVQHHHAHLASLMAEHARRDETVGLVCDGVGYGEDGSAWGGEILVGDLGSVQRVGHLRPLRLPGGDAAARRTGRCAISWMADALDLETAASHARTRQVLSDPREREAVVIMLARDLNCPPSTGMARLFDGAAALLGLCEYNHYEARSGQLLEAAASRSTGRPDGGDLIPLDDGVPFELDTRPLLLALLRGLERGRTAEDLAWLFHDALADALARSALRVAGARGIDAVGLTGGVFCNILLTERVRARLEGAGPRVLTHRLVPPNDGGIAYGQAAVAAARLTTEEG